jgi:hypothetical protein
LYVSRGGESTRENLHLVRAAPGSSQGQKYDLKMVDLAAFILKFRLTAPWLIRLETE